MIEKIYDLVERKEETESVMTFLTQVVKGDCATEELFLDAVRDTRLLGFKEGVAAAMQLISEARA